MTTNTLTASEKVQERKDWIRSWVHANPVEDRKVLYAGLMERFPNVKLGTHRVMVSRLKPWKSLEHECPCCAKMSTGLEDTKKVFGMRTMNGKKYFQSWCRECRASKTEAAKTEAAKAEIERINPIVDQSHEGTPHDAKKANTTTCATPTTKKKPRDPLVQRLLDMVERKDAAIAELRSKYDALKFPNA